MSSRHQNDNWKDCGCDNNTDPADVRTIVDPTQTIVNTTTNRHVIRRVHPTRIVNVNRNIYRIEHFYPVTQTTQNQNVVENFDCGSDLNNPNCRRVGGTGGTNGTANNAFNVANDAFNGTDGSFDGTTDDPFNGTTNGMNNASFIEWE